MRYSILLLLLFGLSAFSVSQGQQTAGYSVTNVSVSPQGDCSVNLPLDCSPGISGIKLQMALTVGAMGQPGVSSSLLSSISRTPPRKDIHGESRPLDIFDANKYWSLSGSMLILNEEESTPTRRVFNPESDPKIRVQAFGQLPDGSPEYFLISSDGHKMELGRTTDAKAYAINTSIPISYHANTIVDAAGNTVYLEYEHDRITGEHFIKHIRYHENLAAEIFPFASVEFEYEPRPDRQKYYLQGECYQQTKRLKSVTNLVNGLDFRSYFLHYNDAPGELNNVSEIEECGMGGLCLPSTLLEYSGNDGPEIKIRRNKNKLASAGFLDRVHQAIPLAFSGQGINDFLLVQASPDGNNFSLIAAKGAPNFSSLSAEQLRAIEPHIFSHPDRPPLEEFYLNKGHGKSKVLFSVPSEFTDGNPINPIQVVPADFNNDGKTDFGVLRPTNRGTIFSKTLSIYLSRSDQNEIAFEKVFETDNLNVADVRVDDLDGNNYPDLFVDLVNIGIVGVAPSVSFLSKPSGNNEVTFERSEAAPIFSSFIYPERLLADIDGDNRSDLFRYGSDLRRVSLTIDLLAENPTVTQLDWLSDRYFTPLASDKYALSLATVNNDRYPDLVVTEFNRIGQVEKVDVFLNKGNLDFERTPIVTHEAANVINNDTIILDAKRTPMFMDFDNDRNIDMVKVSRHTVTVRRGNGLGKFGRLTAYDINPYNPSRWWHDFFRDINKDYNFFPGRYNANSSLSFAGLHRRPDNTENFMTEVFATPRGRLSRVIKGNGSSTDIFYSSSLDPNVVKYDPNFSPASATAIKYRGPKPVVSHVVHTNPAQTLPTGLEYTYTDPVMDISGFGFLGFRTVSTCNVNTKERITNRYVQDFYLAGASPVETTVYLDNKLKDRTKRTITSRVVRPNVRQTLITEIEAKQFDPESQEVLASTFETYTFDDFSNVINHTSVYLNGVRDSVQNIYEVDPSRGFYDRLTSTTRTTTKDSGQQKIRKATFSYDPNGFLLSETTQPGDTTEVSKNYLRDNTGNIIETKVSAWDGESTSTRVSSTVFDANGRFPIQLIDEQGNATHLVYDPLCGKVVQQIDPLGLVTSIQYDNLGRKVLQTFPNGNYSKFEYLPVNAMVGDTYAAYALRETSNAGVHRTTYLDTHERPVRLEQIDPFGRKIIILTRYDLRGNAVATSKPFFEGDLPVYTETEYDLQNRPKVQTNPDGTEISWAYHGKSTSFTNTFGLTATSTENDYGQVINFKSFSGQEVQNTYDPLTGTLSVISAGDRIQLSLKSDNRGKIAKVTDRTAGASAFKNNAFGELLSATTPFGTTTYTRNDKGRLVAKQNEGQEAFTYTYHESQKIASISGPGYQVSYTFDAFARHTSETRVIDDISFTTTFGYNDLGQQDLVVTPANDTIRFTYKRGTLHRVFLNEEPVWELISTDAAGHITRFKSHQQTVTDRQYDPATGSLLFSMVSTPSELLFHEAYAYDTENNLKSKINYVDNTTSEYTYDQDNQLRTVTDENNVTVTTEFNAFGDLMSKSDVGKYFWSETTGRLDSIQLNPDVECPISLQLDIRYGTNTKVRQISNDSVTVNFFYGPSDERVKMEVFMFGQPVLTRYYVGLTEVDVTHDEPTVHRTHLVAGGEVVGTISKQEETTSFLASHNDYQGSARVISNQGAVLQKHTYDPWGKRTSSVNNVAEAFSRGFTAHEHMDIIGLINMNGRVYDPTLAIFLSPDPMYPNTYVATSFNRFAYLHNNPLAAHGDPTGYFKILKGIKKIGKGIGRAVGKVVKGVVKLHTKAISAVAQTIADNWKTILVVAVAVGVGIATGGLGVVASGFLSGFASSYLGARLNGMKNGAALWHGFKAGALSAASAGLTFQVAEGAKHLKKGGLSNLRVQLHRAIGHSAVQGGSAAISGGNPLRGALAGGLTSLISPASGKWFEHNKPANLIANMSVGGLSSELSGGSWVSGATSSAMVTMYNDWRHREYDIMVNSQEGDPTTLTLQEIRETLGYDYDPTTAEGMVELILDFENFRNSTLGSIAGKAGNSFIVYQVAIDATVTGYHFYQGNHVQGGISAFNGIIGASVGVSLVVVGAPAIVAIGVSAATAVALKAFWHSQGY